MDTIPGPPRERPAQTPEQQSLARGCSDLRFRKVIPELSVEGRKKANLTFGEVRSNRLGELLESTLMNGHAAFACAPSVNAACLPTCSACLASRSPKSCTVLATSPVQPVW